MYEAGFVRQAWLVGPGGQCGYKHDILHEVSGVRRTKAIFNMRVMAHEGHRRKGTLHVFLLVTKIPHPNSSLQYGDGA